MARETIRIIMGNSASAFSVESLISQIEQKEGIKGGLTLNFTERLQLRYERGREGNLTRSSGLLDLKRHFPKRSGKIFRGVKFVSVEEVARNKKLRKLAEPR